ALGLMGSLGYYWRALMANLVMGWWFLRGLGRNGLRPPGGAVTGPPVLCVHGFLRNGTCMWGMRRALQQRGRPTRAVSMGRPLRRIQRYAPRLEAALRELVAAHPGEKIDVVAHSMGGLVLRLVLCQSPDLAPSIGHIVTLGSPHHGTESARGAWMLPETEQLAPGSAFLDRLPDFRTCAPGCEVTTLATEYDFIVFPKSTSHFPGSRAVEIPRSSHPGLITEREVIEHVAELIAGRSSP
ncbi:MAG: alpha/beta fold hydrolase, partial [Acidobacteriota bacterium]